MRIIKYFKREDEDRERAREVRASTFDRSPHLHELRQFGKGFWIFTFAHSLQNACLKSFLALSVAFLVSAEWE
jgi:hypothetical protein